MDGCELCHGAGVVFHYADDETRRQRPSQRKRWKVHACACPRCDPQWRDKCIGFAAPSTP